MAAEPWSVPVRLSEIARGPETLTLSPDERARERIARALGLVALPVLSAEVTLSPWFDGVEVEAHWRAEVIQTCGVSLDAFDSALEGGFRVRAVPAGSRLAPASVDDAAIDPEADDPPDLLEGDAVDIGAYVVEHLSLELDPFPRKPGAEFEPPPAENPASPFAVLQGLAGSSGPKPG